MSLATYETTVAISDVQLRELVKWTFYATRYMQVNGDLYLMAQHDQRIGEIVAEMEQADAALTAGAEAYPDGAAAFHARFPQGFQSL